MTFCDNETVDKGSGRNAVICESETLTQLVSGATCGTCGKCELAVVEVENKRKGLASLLELKCTNVACPSEVLSAAYTSQRATAAGCEMSDPEQSSGSARDSFALNVKAVLAARAIGIGHDQLVRFCGILGLPKPLHHKTFSNISKKVHAAATKAVSDNLAEARRASASEAAQGKAVLPIYKRLTDIKLLARCLQVKTQNAAESLNSKIWMLCPKTRFAARTAVETATAIAVLWFNRGHSSFEQVLEELGVLPSKQLVHLSSAADQKRITSMYAKLTAEARSHRRRQLKRARAEDSNRKDREGSTY
ncbi:hypothetical protein ISCGN_021984 [Ixodes scapularis]